MRNWKQLYAAIGTIAVDLGKLSFGSLILGSVLRSGYDPVQIFIGGTAIAIILFVIGVGLILRGKE